MTGRTTQVLLDAIMNREFADDRLPSEPELAEQLAVSRTTVRAALQSLERLGVLSRAPGRGTNVRAHVGRESVVLQQLSGFRDLLEQRHQTVEIHQAHEVTEMTDELAQRLGGLSAGASVVRIARTFDADGVPVIRILDYVPLRNFAPEEQERLLGGAPPDLQGSIFEFSQQWPSRSIDHTVVELVPSVAAQSPRTLTIEPGTPFMRLVEVHYTSRGEAVALSEIDVDDRSIRFSVVH